MFLSGQIMFDYSLLHWTTFFTAAVLLNLSPGPDFAFILGQTAKVGRKQGFIAMFGIWTGALSHVLMATFGLSAILTTSAIAFSVVKWLGALYLIYLGIQMIWLRVDDMNQSVAKRQISSKKVYWQGVLIATLNPKVGIFFLAFLPQFVVAGSGPIADQIFLHGILIIAVAAIIEPVLVLIGEHLSNSFKSNKALGAWIERLLGTLFISLEIKLASSTNS